MSLPIRDTAPAPFPAQRLDHLDDLWIQIAGTLCNLECTHCFVTSGPGVLRHPLMSRTEIAARVAEGRRLGVRAFYLTGGEPFMHPELLPIVADTLPHGPVTVLTNGTLFTRARLAGLAGLAAGARYSLEIRISLDGPDAVSHDAFRGAGSFERTLAGAVAAEAAGLLPIVTVTQSEDVDPLAYRERLAAMLRARGIRRPRLKVLPMFRLGREARRTRGYGAEETLAGLPESALETGGLQCGSCRAVTAKGVYVCPLLVDEPGGRMGDTLEEALAPFTLAHGACHTCYVTGMTCANG